MKIIIKNYIILALCIATAVQASSEKVPQRNLSEKQRRASAVAAFLNQEKSKQAMQAEDEPQELKNAITQREQKLQNRNCGCPAESTVHIDATCLQNSDNVDHLAHGEKA